MKKIVFFLLYSLILLSCTNQNTTAKKTTAESNLSVKYSIIYLNDTPCCREIVLQHLSFDGISNIHWELHSQIVRVDIDSTKINTDSVLTLLNKIVPNKIRFSKLYEQFPSHVPQEDTSIIITTPKTEEELTKEKEKISV